MSRASAAISALDIAFADGARLPHQAARHRPATRRRGSRRACIPCMVPQAAPIAHGRRRVQRRGGRGRFRRPRHAGGPRRRRRPHRLGRRRGPDRHRARPADAGLGRRRPTRCRRCRRVPMAAHVGAYYLRLMVVDRPGVIADVTAILRDAGRLAGIDAAARPQPRARRCRSCWSRMRRVKRRCATALAEIAALPTVLEPPALIRIERVLKRPKRALVRIGQV